MDPKTIGRLGLGLLFGIPILGCALCFGIYRCKEAIKRRKWEALQHHKRDEERQRKEKEEYYRLMRLREVTISNARSLPASLPPKPPVSVPMYRPPVVVVAASYSYNYGGSTGGHGMGANGSGYGADGGGSGYGGDGAGCDGGGCDGGGEDGCG